MVPASEPITTDPIVDEPDDTIPANPILVDPLPEPEPKPIDPTSDPISEDPTPPEPIPNDTELDDGN